MRNSLPSFPESAKIWIRNRLNTPKLFYVCLFVRVYRESVNAQPPSDSNVQAAPRLTGLNRGESVSDFREKKKKKKTKDFSHF